MNEKFYEAIDYSEYEEEYKREEWENDTFKIVLD